MSDLIGGATPPAGEPAVGTPPAATPPQGTLPPEAGPQIPYPEGFSDEFHNDPSIMKFYDKEKNSFNQANMMTSLIHAQKMIGGNKMMVPTKDSTPDDWNKIHKALGLPDRENYSVDVEGVDPLDPMTKGFLDTAHKAGILPQQAKEIIGYFNEANKTMGVSDEAESKALMDAQVGKLKSDWGSNYESNLGVVNETVKNIFSEDEAKMAQEAGYFADPTFIRLMNSVGNKMLDDKTLDGARTSATGFSNAEDIRNEYQQLMQNPQLKTSQALKDKQMYLLEQATKKGVQLY